MLYIVVGAICGTLGFFLSGILLTAKIADEQQMKDYINYLEGNIEKMKAMEELNGSN